MSAKTKGTDTINQHKEARATDSQRVRWHEMTFTKKKKKQQQLIFMQAAPIERTPAPVSWLAAGQ